MYTKRSSIELFHGVDFWFTPIEFDSKLKKKSNAKQ